MPKAEYGYREPSEPTISWGKLGLLTIGVIGASMLCVADKGRPPAQHETQVSVTQTR
jgi:hypothetical protein